MRSLVGSFMDGLQCNQLYAVVSPTGTVLTALPPYNYYYELGLTNDLEVIV